MNGVKVLGLVNVRPPLPSLDAPTLITRYFVLESFNRTEVFMLEGDV